MQIYSLNIISNTFELNRKILDQFLIRYNLSTSKYEQSSKFDQIYLKLLNSYNLVSENKNYNAKKADKEMIDLINLRAIKHAKEIAEFKYRNDLLYHKKDLFKEFVSHNNNPITVFMQDVFNISLLTQIEYLKQKYDLIIKK
jgi:hypothetical protein